MAKVKDTSNQSVDPTGFVSDDQREGDGVADTLGLDGTVAGFARDSEASGGDTRAE